MSPVFGKLCLLITDGADSCAVKDLKSVLRWCLFGAIKV